MKQTCPRRMTEMGPWEREEDLDRWQERDGLRRCSFCGSMHPADFLAAIEQHDEIGPTDKSYKFYVDAHSGKFYTQHLSEEQGWKFDQLWRERKINWGYPGAPYVPLFIPGPSTREAE